MILPLILLAFDFYLTRMLLYPLLENHVVLFTVLIGLLQIIVLSMMWLFFYFFKSDADTCLKFEEQLRDTAFIGMGIFSFLIVFTLARDLLGMILYFTRGFSIFNEQSSFLILSLTAISVFIGALNARYRIITPKIEIKIQQLPESLENLKIVQLSDMHLGTGPKPKQIAKLVDRALAMNPDLIALTGDIIDGNISEMPHELQELSRLKATYGVYFVLGNHEVYWKYKETIQKMKQLGFTVLLNEGVEISVKGETVFIAGINDPTLASITHQANDAPKIALPPDYSKLNIALVHQPHFSKKISEIPSYHLQLSGHTHGGQFFPWNFAVKKIYEFHAGLGKTKNLWVYVNTGSGYWGPPIRLGTHSEITELSIKATEPFSEV